MLRKVETSVGVKVAIGLSSPPLVTTVEVFVRLDVSLSRSSILRRSGPYYLLESPVSKCHSCHSMMCQASSINRKFVCSLIYLLHLLSSSSQFSMKKAKEEYLVTLEKKTWMRFYATARAEEHVFLEKEKSWSTAWSIQGKVIWRIVDTCDPNRMTGPRSCIWQRVRTSSCVDHTLIRRSPDLRKLGRGYRLFLPLEQQLLDKFVTRS